MKQDQGLAPNAESNGTKAVPPPQVNPEIQIKIVSATYGPCEGLRLATGELTNDEATSIPLSRDVAPFLRALLIVGQLLERQQAVKNTAATIIQNRTENDNNEEKHSHELVNAPHHVVHVNPIINSGASTTVKPSWIYLLGGEKPMNAVFGDPCPGTSKRLHVHYIVTETLPGDTTEMLAAKTEVHHVSFAEHDMVVFRRRLTFFQDDSQLKAAVQRATTSKKRKMVDDNECREEERTKATSLLDPVHTSCGGIDEDDNEILKQARKMGRSQSIAELAAISADQTKPTNDDSCPQMQQSQNVEPDDSSPAPSSSLSPSCRKWRLRSAVSEMVLPLVLPFLHVQERVQCSLICRTWQHVIRDWGVATTIDSNDSTISDFSRPFLRGILSHSHTSLKSLFLSGFESLQKTDLHPAIPNLRNLRSFDVTRCHDLDDSTMILLSQHVHRTLEVLYIKGLRNVSDVGVQTICNSCDKLEVLDISHVPVTDKGGMAIAKLVKLRALFMRDNYQLTNASIDVITENCSRLAQLTLWGCTRIKHLRFDSINQVAFKSGKLVILNLWGCHGLKDEAAESLGNMSNLSSLVVSECHRLTDRFVETLASVVPNLNHLHLRYCRRLTDSAIQAITKSMRHLYSLDLSFCSRITSSALSNLLEVRHDSLAELRLKSCRNLKVCSEPQERSILPARASRERNGDGQLMLNAIRSRPTHCLCLLDLRDCGGGYTDSTEAYPETDPFVVGLNSLHFEQRVPGFFSRPSRWTSLQQQLVEQVQAGNNSQQSH